MKKKSDEKALQEALNTSEDPLLATAMAASIAELSFNRKSHESGGLRIDADRFVETDAESLARREEQIARQPLGELLSSTGYSSIDLQGNSDAVSRSVK